ncbi:MAG: cytochrome c-type biogenesis protein CcmH [Vicinamibacterales bacterium]
MFALLPFVLALTTTAPLPAHLESEARQIEREVVAPCCWSQQVSIHQSPAADEVRKDIRVRLARGETHQAIIDDYVVQFGTRILVEPPASGYKRLLYVFPPVALVLSAAGVVAFLKRASAKHGENAPPAADGTSTSGYDQQLNDELRELD